MSSYEAQAGNCTSHREHRTPLSEVLATRSYSRGYPDISSVMRTREDFLTQLSPGEMVCHARTVSAGRASLIGLWERPKCIGGTLLNPGSYGVIIPLSWDGDFVMNGHSIDRGEVFSVDSADGFLSHGSNRYFYGLQVERQLLLKTLAALKGVHLEDVNLPSGPLRLTHRSIAFLGQRFDRQLYESGSKGVLQEQQSYALMDFLYEVMLEIHLSIASPRARPRPSWRRATQIVRKAEARFAAMEGPSMSLADLCAATSVSSSTLYQAFEQVVGMPPLRFFRLRRINDVHQKLMGSACGRGGVTECATAHGFSELGRFSADYKKVFGVSPSVTLAAN